MQTACNMTNVIFIIVSVFVLFQKSVCDNGSHTYLDYFYDIYFNPNLSGISENCTKIFRNRNFTQTIYFDATAKLPEGINNGNFFDLGNFDQCYNHAETIDEDTHLGKYCLGFMGIGDSKDFPFIHLNFVKNDTFGIYTGFCLSNQCTLEDFSKLFYKHSFVEERCYSKDAEQKMSVGAWVTISIIVAIAAIIICSTLYHSTLMNTGKEPTNPSLVIFSAVRNAEKIFATSNNPQQILCLNGIRTMSMMWIIAHHEFLTLTTGPIGNYYDVVEFFSSPKTMFLNQTSVSVDSFLTIAGILTAYTLMKRKNINVIESYVHRYFRLTPVLAMTILMLSTLYTHAGDGPLWSDSSEMADSCTDHWWVFLLYVQNFIPTGTCAGHAWYLGVDMHCYIVAAVIMIFLKKSSRITLTGIGLLILLGAIISIWICYNLYDLPIGTIDYDAEALNLMTYYYKPTYTRYGPYLIGMICGYIIYNTKSSASRYKIPMVAKIIYWIITLALLATCIYLPLAIKVDSVWQNALFLSMYRFVWSACICSIVLMCDSDNADFVNKFLSLPLFQVVARLSYCVYIIHPVWIAAKVASTKTVVNYSLQKVIIDSWGTTVASLLISFFLSMMFEMPAPEVEKYFVENLKKIVCVITSAIGMKSEATKS